MANMFVNGSGPAIDASYQVLLHLAEGFQRRRLKCDDGKSSHCLWQGELKRVQSTRSASNKVYQLLARGQWFSPVSFTTKTGRHDIADILLKVELKHQKSNQIKSNLDNYTGAKNHRRY